MSTLPATKGRGLYRIDITYPGSRTPLLRCHRQYLVNLAHLQEIRLEDNGQAELILRNGLTVPVSRRYLKSLKEAIGL